MGKSGKEPRRVWAVFEEILDRRNGAFIPVIVVEGEHGYRKTDYRWRWPWEMAKEKVKALNADLGITEREATKIIARSMRLDF